MKFDVRLTFYKAKRNNCRDFFGMIIVSGFKPQRWSDFDDAARLFPWLFWLGRSAMLYLSLSWDVRRRDDVPDNSVAAGAAAFGTRGWQLMAGSTSPALSQDETTRFCWRQN